MNRYVKSNSVVMCRFSLAKAVCMETFDTLPQLGRFSLRDEGKTIAIGKVTKIINWTVCFNTTITIFLRVFKNCVLNMPTSYFCYQCK